MFRTPWIYSVKGIGGTIMEWKVNNKGTINNLKNNDLDICIHKIYYYGNDNWFLSCHKLGIQDFNLNTENFNEAVKQAQVEITERATKLYELATDFTKNVWDNNEFTKY